MRPRRRLGPVLVAALGLLTGLLGVAAVLAPVDADDPVVTWPRAGEPPASTVLPLSPYRPLELRATVPCATLRALDARGGGEALRTLPADVDPELGSGLVVAVRDGTVTVSAGPQLVVEPLAEDGCAYAVEADGGGLRVLLRTDPPTEPDMEACRALRAPSQADVEPCRAPEAGAVLVERADLLPPQVAMLQTEAEGLPEAAGLAVELRPDARYESSPSALKLALLVAHAVALAVLLALARRAWPGRGGALVRPRASVADAGVLVVSAAWAVLGPMNIDDSWYALMARNATASGYVGNYIYQFNVTENPFVLAQYAMQAWGSLGGWGLLWLRVLPLVYGLATYAVLRVLLATVLGRAHPRVAPWALAGAHLAWFLPYGITLRPEPLIVLGSAVVLLLAELARRRESIGLLAAATAVAALTMTVSPTALVAVAPLVLALPFLWRRLRAAGVAERVAAVLLAVATATVVVPVGFADASLGDVLESVAVHRWYYRQHPWHDEFVHYANLLGPDDQGAWGKRLPVLLTLAVLGASLVGLGRRAGTGGPSGRLLRAAALVTALGLVSMSLTPTKWVNHFGAVAAPATLLLALALLRSPVPRRAPRAAFAAATALAVAAASVAFAGPNLWRPFGDWGQPFGNHRVLDTPLSFAATAPGIGPLHLRNPLLWLAVATLAVWWARRAGRAPAPAPDRAVLGMAVAGGVALMLLVFTAAPLSHAPGASVASTNLAALRGDACGLAGEVRAGGRPVAEVVAGTPVFADQVSAVLWPCVDQIAIVHGIAEAPRFRLRAGDGLEGAVEENSTFAPNGGTLVQVDRVSRFVELPSALDPPGGEPMMQWGHVEQVRYRHPGGGYDLVVGAVRRSGWERLPTLAGEAYTGRQFIG
ncbi:MAG TPA: arabinosyltransferase domain-containing protein [Pseudonocardia sp.]|nr:arabinosyltransferase domain-containing protein [Pseudonocardia sp.]